VEPTIPAAVIPAVPTPRDVIDAATFDNSAPWDDRHTEGFEKRAEGNKWGDWQVGAPWNQKLGAPWASLPPQPLTKAASSPAPAGTQTAKVVAKTVNKAVQKAVEAEVSKVEAAKAKTAVAAPKAKSEMVMLPPHGVSEAVTAAIDKAIDAKIAKEEAEAASGWPNAGEMLIEQSIPVVRPGLKTAEAKEDAEAKVDHVAAEAKAEKAEKKAEQVVAAKADKQVKHADEQVKKKEVTPVKTTPKVVSVATAKDAAKSLEIAKTKLQEAVKLKGEAEKAAEAAKQSKASAAAHTQKAKETRTAAEERVKDANSAAEDAKKAVDGGDSEDEGVESNHWTGVERAVKSARDLIDHDKWTEVDRYAQDRTASPDDHAITSAPEERERIHEMARKKAAAYHNARIHLESAVAKAPKKGNGYPDEDGKFTVHGKPIVHGLHGVTTVATLKHELVKKEAQANRALRRMRAEAKRALEDTVTKEEHREVTAKDMVRRHANGQARENKEKATEMSNKLNIQQVRMQDKANKLAEKAKEVAKKAKRAAKVAAAAQRSKIAASKAHEVSSKAAARDEDERLAKASVPKSTPPPPQQMPLDTVDNRKVVEKMQDEYQQGKKDRETQRTKKDKKEAKDVDEAVKTAETPAAEPKATEAKASTGATATSDKATTDDKAATDDKTATDDKAATDGKAVNPAATKDAAARSLTKADKAALQPAAAKKALMEASFVAVTPPETKAFEELEEDARSHGKISPERQREDAELVQQLLDMHPGVASTEEDQEEEVEDERTNEELVQSEDAEEDEDESAREFAEKFVRPITMVEDEDELEPEDENISALTMEFTSDGMGHY